MVSIGDRWGLPAFVLFTLTALAGYGIFGIRPDRLPESGAVVAFWSISFRFFAQAHIIVAAIVLGLALALRTGWRWVGAGVAVYLISFFSEFVGTGYGFPFGDYGYTNLLGAKLGGRIPFLIPLSWFLMALPSYAIATFTFPGRGDRVRRIGFAVLLLVVWDLALDPAMSHRPPLYWSWDAPEAFYYGMPWMNLLGWALTGAVIMSTLEGLGVREWSGKLSLAWTAGFYGATLLMPLGMILLQGLWLGVGATVSGLILCVAIHRYGTRGRTAGAGVPTVAEPRRLEPVPVEES